MRFTIPLPRIVSGRWLALGAILSFTACSGPNPAPSDPKSGRTTHHANHPHKEPEVIPLRCTPAWNRLVDRRLGISDSSGHGPDIGSAEWMSAVGKKSGVVDASGHGPDPGGDEWCHAVDWKVFGRR